MKHKESYYNLQPIENQHLKWWPIRRHKNITIYYLPRKGGRVPQCNDFTSASSFSFHTLIKQSELFFLQRKKFTHWKKHKVMAVYRCCMVEILFTRDSFCILKGVISGYFMLDKMNIVLCTKVSSYSATTVIVNYFTAERLQSSERKAHKAQE